MKNINPTQTSAWQALQKHFDEMKDVTISELFAKDSDRFSKFSATFDDLMLVDFSKNRITEETLAKLQDLAKETDWRAPSSPCSPVRRSTAPKIARYCTSRCATAAIRRLWLMAKM
jgi:hypothetical protein